MGTFPVDMKIDHLQYWLKSCGFDIMCSTQHYFDWINSRQKCFGLNQLHDGLDDELMPVLLLGSDHVDIRLKYDMAYIMDAHEMYHLRFEH